MKKTMLGLILLGGVGFLLSSCGAKVSLVNTQEIPLQDINQISVNYHADDLDFYESDSDELKIEEYLTTNQKSAKADITIKDQQVTIDRGKRSMRWLTLNPAQNHINIYLPKNYHERLNITLTSGTLNTHDAFNLTELSVKSSSGKLMIDAVKAQNIDLTSSSGKIKAASLSADTTHIKSTSGGIKVQEATSKRLTAETTSGSIKISALEGDATVTATSGKLSIQEIIGSAQFKTSSGSINASFKNVTGDISANTTSGRIDLTIPKATEFNYQNQTSSGRLTTDFDHELSGKNGNYKSSNPNSDLMISTKTTSGSVKVVRE